MKLNTLIGEKLSFDESADDREISIYLCDSKAVMLMVINIAYYCKIPDFMKEKMTRTLEYVVLFSHCDFLITPFSWTSRFRFHCVDWQNLQGISCLISTNGKTSTKLNKFG